MDFTLCNFVEQPTLDLFNGCTKEQLVEIADHFKVGISKQLRKHEFKTELWSALTALDVLPPEPVSPSKDKSFEMLRLRELDLEMRRLDLKEKELVYDLEMRKMEEETKRQIKMKELEIQQSSRSPVTSDDFDINRCFRLVPPFNDKDVDKYFILFERVATTLKWPKGIWPLLLQCVFTGKAQDAYASLSPQASLDYHLIKVAVLRAYELVPEAYRQRFRKLKKTDTVTHVEFGREKEALFDRWCQSKKVRDFDKLRDLILLEDFRNCLPDKIATYINEQNVNDVSKAAVLADEYVLTHRSTFEKSHPSLEHRFSSFKPSVPSLVLANPNDGKSRVEEGDKPICMYCKKRGHTIKTCFALERKNKTPKVVNLLKTEPQSQPLNFSLQQALVKPDLQVYAPFLMKGFVSLTDEGPKVPVTILRDSAASQSVLLEGVLPLSDKSSVNARALVRGFGMQWVGVPLHSIHLDCDLVKGGVVVGVSPQFPIEGVALILGNDLAGGKVLLNPEVTAIPLIEQSAELQREYPGVFSVCAVTRAMAERGKQDLPTGEDDNIDLSDSFLTEVDSGIPSSVLPPPVDSVSDSPPVESAPSPVVLAAPCSPGKDLKLSMSKDQLIVEQKRDQSLSPLFEAAVLEDEIKNMSTGYFIKNDVLLRKWTPHQASKHDEWRVVTQIVVPQAFRHEILLLAHDNPLAGHLGVNKTYDRVLRCFFWPGLKRDVRQHCKTCHVCQVAGRPNQVIPSYPLYPIPVVGEPFERVLVDCVGPFPRTKSGNKFLLTIMCSATRFPEAIPMRKITAPAVVKALVRFFSIFGLPKVLQTDQGSNFMSRIFAQVLKQLNIAHCHSSAYHPESQGAIERFHQTLKSMLRKYCLEFDKDWDEGVHLLLFAAREVVQESLGFSPAELVFAHTVRGPLRLLREKWLSDPKPQNLCDYVSSFRFRLHRACELAKGNIAVVQTKMKTWFDKDAQLRRFSPGDQVLVLLPIPGSALQARYSGPYKIKEKLNDRDYIVNTPDRRRRSRLCHINMLKPYLGREGVSVPPPEESIKTVLLSSTVSTDVQPFDEGDVTSPSTAVVQGRLKNSEILSKLDESFSDLDELKREHVVKLIRSHVSLFSDVPTRTHVLQHDIDVGDSPPIKQHAYRVNPDKRRRLQEQVDYMMDNDIAEPSCSSWSSPCLLADKADGSDRFCTDFRKVNGVTKPDCYPLPRVEDCVDNVGSANFVSKLDLLKGYWQVPLTPRAKEVSAFVTPDAFLQYTVMPFGVRNAPATFQRLINTVLCGVTGCEAYLDDVVVYSSTWEEHIEKLHAVFDRLQAANLTLNLAKCEFGQATVTYLGKIVGRGQVKPIQSKVEAILSFPAPSSRRELRRFLGMAGYYRSFCRNFSAVAAPLTDLLSPKRRYHWSENCQHAFDCIKALMTHAPVLAAPQFDRSFKLSVDASDAGAGAVLLQQGDDGVEHPVSYFSKKFNHHQRVYSTIEKEALSLVLALKHFEVYVGSTGVPTEVFTDHNPLVFIHQMKNSNRRLMRWALFLQSFNINVHHVKGTRNVLADTLSRGFSDG